MKLVKRLLVQTNDFYKSVKIVKMKNCFTRSTHEFIPRVVANSNEWSLIHKRLQTTSGCIKVQKTRKHFQVSSKQFRETEKQFRETGIHFQETGQLIFP